MRSNKNVGTVKLRESKTLKEAFSNYKEMAGNTVDWTLFCTYQLKPSFPGGIYKILQLPSMQIAYTQMDGGVMFDYIVPEGCMTFSFMKEVSQKACIDQMKLHTGMIAVVNDKKIYSFTCSGPVEILDISLCKNTDPVLIKKLKQSVDKYYIDEDQDITTLIKSFITKFVSDDTPLDTDNAIKIEKQITEAMLKLVNTQEAQTPHFTKSEKIAMEIKQKLFKHMDHNISVTTLASQYGISVKSLQNAFRSLFDLKPNEYMRLLKLNLVHHELIQSSSSGTTVQKVARKWGFKHMGRFSKYYTELFGENPSITLKTKNPLIDGMATHCVERKESTTIKKGGN